MHSRSQLDGLSLPLIDLAEKERDIKLMIIDARSSCLKYNAGGVSAVVASKQFDRCRRCTSLDVQIPVLIDNKYFKANLWFKDCPDKGIEYYIMCSGI